MSSEQELVDTIIIYALGQHVKGATRHDPNTKPSLFDFILTHYESDSYMPRHVNVNMKF